MTYDIEALQSLLDKVEAGDLHEQRHGGMPLATACYCKDDVGRFIDKSWNDANVLRAYNGSLDAAKALHEAVLPSARWQVTFTDGTHDVAISHAGLVHGTCISDTPASAWLIAVLKALIAGEKGDV